MRPLKLDYNGYEIVIKRRKSAIFQAIDYTAKLTSPEGNTYHLSHAYDDSDKDIEVHWANLAEAVYDVVRTIKGR
jgi:hypothetical protein